MTAMQNDGEINCVAIVGTGVVGASWAACLLAHGLDVIATDPAPGAEAALYKYVESAWPAPAWWADLGIPDISNPQLQERVNRGVLEEVAGRSLEELVGQRDALLIGLLQLLADDAAADTRRGSVPEPRHE
jgi:glycine/D-amino acid oxidase-like deaminating enzyme